MSNVTTVLGQAILDSGVSIIKEDCPTDGFQCFKIEGAIPADENQRGSTQNFYYFNSSNVDESLPQATKDAINALDENSNKAAIEAAYLLWIVEQPYTEKPEALVSTEVTE